MHPKSLVRSEHFGFHIATGFRIPLAEVDIFILRELHVPAIRIGHEVPARILIFELPDDCIVHVWSLQAHHQRLLFNWAIPVTASRLKLVLHAELAILPEIANRIRFIPPVDRCYCTRAICLGTDIQHFLVELIVIHAALDFILHMPAFFFCPVTLHTGKTGFQLRQAFIAFIIAERIQRKGLPGM